MIVTHVAATDALSYQTLRLDFAPELTVIVGPNGSGKSNVGRLLSIASGAVAACVDLRWDQFNAAWGQAGRYGSPDWEVRVGVAFDATEDGLIEAWLRGCLLRAIAGSNHSNVVWLDETMAVDLSSSDLFGTGEIVVRREAARRHPWLVSWETAGGEARLSLGAEHRLHFGPPGQWQADSINVSQWLEGLGDPLSDRRIGGRSTRTARDILSHSGIDLVAQLPGQEFEPPAMRFLLEELGLPRDTNAPAITFARILNHLVTKSLLVIANTRSAPIIEASIEQLTDRHDLSDGSGTALELLRRKNGDNADRGRYERGRALFRELLGTTAEIDLSVARSTTKQGEIRVTPLVSQIPPGGSQRVDVPLALSGAGFQEAAFLSTVLTEDRSALLLDEPATNLSSTAQRRLLTSLRQRAGGRQTIVITHTAGLVPAASQEDLSAIVRLATVEGSTKAHRLGLSRHETERALQQLQLADVRDLLFSAGICLLEGASDRAALDVWLADASAWGLPTPDEAHVRLMSVDGHKSFPSYVALAREFAIPWSALADGPALRGGGPLKKLEADDQAPPAAWDAAKSYWAQHRVHTFADGFHDDKSKKGEIEAFFRRVDAAAFAAAEAEFPRSKPLQSAAFAMNVPPPAEVKTFWRRVLADLELRAADTGSDV